MSVWFLAVALLFSGAAAANENQQDQVDYEGHKENKVCKRFEILMADGKTDEEALQAILEEANEDVTMVRSVVACALRQAGSTADATQLAALAINAVSGEDLKQEITNIALANNVDPGELLGASNVVVTTGTFLRGLMHRGSSQTEGGRIDEPAAKGLSGCLKQLGFELGRLKTVAHSALVRRGPHVCLQH